jgi:hypothetical protein
MPSKKKDDAVIREILRSDNCIFFNPKEEPFVRIVVPMQVAAKSAATGGLLVLVRKEGRTNAVVYSIPVQKRL